MDAKSCPLIANIGVYNAPIILTTPTILRDKDGLVRFIPGDNESEIYFTTDGSSLNPNTKKYSLPVKIEEGKIEIKAMAYNPFTKKYSVVNEEKFDISRKNWHILSTNDSTAN